MSSRDETLIELGSKTPEPSITSSLPNAFGRMMQGGASKPTAQQRDRYKRPTPTYNHNYNPFNTPPKDLPSSYTLYVRGEPLFNDREVIVSRLPVGHIVTSVSKRPRTV
jgi:hypothetical protein